MRVVRGLVVGIWDENFLDKVQDWRGVPGLSNPILDIEGSLFNGNEKRAIDPDRGSYMPQF